MSVGTIFRIHRTGRPNVPNVAGGADTRINWGIMAGIFGAAITGPSVVSTVGYLEIRDAIAATVEIRDEYIAGVEIRDALTTSVETSDG